MPLMFLERFPWPSLQTYTALSAVLLTGSVLSAYTSVTESRFASETEESVETQGEDDESPVLDLGNGLATKVLQHLVSDSFYVWVLVNTACCGLMLIAKMIQCIVFGPLRSAKSRWDFKRDQHKS